MIACVEKTEHNADFHQIVDYLSGCSINYSLLVDPDLIGPWLQQFWATASLRVINEVPHIRAMVAGKRVLISEETIRADLLFDDADGIDCFPKQVIWDSLRDIGYEGNLAQLTFSKPLFSPQWKAESSPRDAQGTPTQSAAQASSLQGTADFQGTAEAQGAAGIPLSPNDYTPTDESQTSGGDEGLLDLYALNREVRRLKKQTISQAKQIHKLKSEARRKEERAKKKVSSVKLGRNKDESNLSEENNDQDDHTTFVYEDFDATDVVTPDLERKSDETEEVIIEEEKDTSDVKSGDTEELDLERIQSTARQSTVTPRTLNFDDEAGPSSPIRPTQEE
ncbi:hypothetical protein Tco_0692226 [Tanacetum coccineum]